MMKPFKHFYTWNSLFAKLFFNFFKKKEPIKEIVSKKIFHEENKNMNIQQIAKLSYSSLLVSSKRVPMIKFNRKGPMLKFVPEKFPVSLSSVGTSKDSFQKVGRISQCLEIDESELPLRYRRSSITEDECNIINNGGVLKKKESMNILFYDYYELNGCSEETNNQIMNSCSREEEEKLAKIIEGLFTKTVQCKPSSYFFITSKRYNQYICPPKKFSVSNFIRTPINKSLSTDDVRKKNFKKHRTKSSCGNEYNNPENDTKNKKQKSNKNDVLRGTSSSKNKNDWINQDEILINILKTITLAKCQLSIILFCKLLNGFVFYCKPQLTQSRLKRFAKIDAANYLLSCLKHKMSSYENPTMMKIATVDALAMVTLYICSKDSKLSIKTRLMGLLPIFANVIVNINYMSCTLNVTMFILRTLKSPRNIQSIGRIKGFCSNIINTLSPILQSPSITSHNSISDSIEVTKVERLLEIIYCLSKNRKNKSIFVDCGGIQMTKDLFEKYFFQQLNDTSTIKLVNQEICLFLIATIRLFAKTKKSKQILIELKILNMCEKFLSELDLQLSMTNDQNVVRRLQSLQDSLCALCMRCLPNKQFFISASESPPLQFLLDEDADDNDQLKNKNLYNDNKNLNDVTCNLLSLQKNIVKNQKYTVGNIDDNQVNGSKEANLSSSSIQDGECNDESNDSFNFNNTLSLSDSDDDNIDEEDEAIISSQCSAEFSPSAIDLDESELLIFDDEELSENVSNSFIKKSPSSKKNKKNTGKTSKSPNTTEIIYKSNICKDEIEKNYSIYFDEYKEKKITENNKIVYKDYTQAITSKCNETCSVGKFVKIAYPEFTGPDLHYSQDEMLLSNNDAMKNMIKDNLQRHNCCHNNLKTMEKTDYPKLVYNLDELVSNENYPNKLSNTDKEDVGIKSHGSNHLLFESRFESGNLRRAYQMDTNFYQLIISPDINQKSHHYQWFYFQVSNMESDREYTFEIVNCLKSTSMFSHGMQPVMFSVIDSLSNSKKGWHRTGNNICYFRNLYTLNSRNDEVNENDDKGLDKVRYFYTIRFSITFKYPNDICYIAYHYPYTYSYLQATLERLVSKKRDKIYYRIDEIGKSLNKNNMKLVTITADPFDDNREIIVISARVHPGETNSSWIMQGILKFLLNNEDEKSHLLREKFIFKIFPMLNPDGVINGSHRCSLSGNDLNRTWHCPIKNIHPEIYHTKDLHGHSRRSNIFIFGNNPEESWLDEDSKIINEEFMKLPEILELSSSSFSITDSRFTIAKSKESSARIALWRQFGIERCYTMESTYCGFDKKDHKGKQINISHLEKMGVDLCLSFLPLLKTNVIQKKL
ncbi:Cytosolic carboxypeptidase NnaD [Strongyloides ratti]|uniref:Cytosolic carboxypeptidase NnaD n=1 Tax=Strongyloides ratti TaxID=34506 RepID=A0A090MYH3_STRRB|nr:Cytosolic carboxypeptidase NnaD [Strongyloides ratti]CEF67184.1 Cytosolic carboxypeptidase NnaD [Strongyloides ratti]